MFKRLFKKRKDEEKEDNSLELRIEEALTKCKNDKRDAENEIEDIKKWAADAIIDIYIDYIPNAKYSYQREKIKATILDDYLQTKEKYAGKIGDELASECDRIVNGYLNQIKLMESKMQLYDKLYNEHLQTKQKLEAYKEKARRLNNLKEHGERIKEMDQDVTELSETMTDTNEFEEINNEFAFKEEYFKQMEQLQLEYADISNLDNSVAYKEQVDNILKGID